MKVRIVELDPDKCEALAEKLPGVYIIQGDGTDSEVIESENLLDYRRLCGADQPGRGESADGP